MTKVSKYLRFDPNADIITLESEWYKLEELRKWVNKQETLKVTRQMLLRVVYILKQEIDKKIQEQKEPLLREFEKMVDPKYEVKRVKDLLNED